MNHRKQSIIIIISLLTLLSCSKQEDSTDRIIDLTSFRNVEQKFNLIEDYNFPAGLILSIAKVNDEQYMFLDFTQRALFILDTFENEVRQFGSKGDGPG